MMQHDTVLIGGGHSHALVIKMLAMRPIAGVRLTLVSESAETPYSGMLPGFIAGHYSREQTYIDLNHLCRWAGVRFIEARANGIDHAKKQLLLEGRPAIGFDTLSLDIGSHSRLGTPSAHDHGIGVKPISSFEQQWLQLLDYPSNAPTVHWAIIGAGAAGVELSLAMAHRLRNHANIKLHLVYRSERILPGYTDKAVTEAEQSLQQYGVTSHPGFSVAKVQNNALESAEGQTIAIDYSVWCAGAAAPTWLTESGLQTDKGGFVTVNSQLQSVSHPDVFASGDIAHLRDDPRPKAGVYAVRQAPFLADNLGHHALQQPLKPINLQSQYLSLLSLGGQRATGTRNGITLSGSWVWKLKHRIDRQFMDRLQHLGTPLPMQPPTPDTPRCGGCGGKLGPDALSDSLPSLPMYPRPEVTPALATAEDASLLEVPAGTSLVQSIDGIRAFSDDLYTVGRAATEHSLNDLYAMGAEPMAAHIWATTAIAHSMLQQRDHFQLMHGVSDALRENRTTLAGGHSSEAMDAAIGVSVTGAVSNTKHWSKRGLEVGDVLVLNKPIGTGVLLAADMQAQAPAASVRAALQSMCRSNRDAASALVAVQPKAVTDVSGFGLLGHLLEMLGDSELSVELAVHALPLLPSALELSAAGWHSSLYPALAGRLASCSGTKDCPAGWPDLLLDPQTSGGLLAAVAADKVEALLSSHPAFVVIGQVLASTDVTKRIRLSC